MTDIEWYRQSDWTPVTAAEFERRLAKSRAQRSEYLRIQALTLAGTKRSEFATAAIELAQRFLELKKTGVGVAQAHATIAQAHATLGQVDAAVAAYRLAVDAEHAQPNVRGCHYLDFTWFVAKRTLISQFDEVLAVTQRNMDQRDLMFPANQYRYFGALALISGALGDKDNARRMAKNALSAAARKQGPFGTQPSLGLAEQDREIQGQLERLADA